MSGCIKSFRAHFGNLLTPGRDKSRSYAPVCTRGSERPDTATTEIYTLSLHDALPISSAASASGPTSIGMQPNVAAGLSYVFTWISGLIIFLIEKQNRFVRFHAMQSLLFFGSITVLSIVIGYIPYVNLLSWVLDLVGFVGWIFLMIQGFQGKYYKLPVIGDYAEKYANSGTM